MTTTVTTINEVVINDDTKITFNVKKNPKREGSKSHSRFQKYMGSKTVSEYLERSGTKGDLKYDWEKGFIQIDGVDKV